MNVKDTSSSEAQHCMVLLTALITTIPSEEHFDKQNQGALSHLTPRYTEGMLCLGCAAPDQVVVGAVPQAGNSAGTRNLLQAAAAPFIYTIQVCCWYLPAHYEHLGRRRCPYAKGQAWTLSLSLVFPAAIYTASSHSSGGEWMKACPPSNTRERDAHACMLSACGMPSCLGRATKPAHRTLSKGCRQKVFIRIVAFCFSIHYGAGAAGRCKCCCGGDAGGRPCTQATRPVAAAAAGQGCAQ